MYGVVYFLAGGLSDDGQSWVVPLAMLGYLVALISWIVYTGQASALGLCGIQRGHSGGFFRYLPLLMLPAYNLLTAKMFYLPLPMLVLMLAVCTTEEVFFRGFLLRYLMRFGMLPAVMLSSGTFALFHFVNLTDGNSVSYIWTQVVCAFALGMCYGIAAIQSGSLIPGLLAHFLTNITAAPMVDVLSPFLWLCIGLHGCYGVCWIRKYCQYQYKEKYS